MKFCQFLCLLLFSYVALHSTSAVSMSASPSIRYIKNVPSLKHLRVELPSFPQSGGEIYLTLTDNNKLRAKTRALLTSEDTICAYGFFRDALNQTGWHQFDVSTEGRCGRLGTMYAAGWVEGYLSYEKIVQYYHNYFRTNQELMNRISDAKHVFKNKYEDALRRSQANRNSKNERERTFWNGIELFAAQFEGLTAGFLSQTRELDQEDLMFVSSNGELGDIVDALDTFLKAEKSEALAQQISGKSSRLRIQKKDNAFLLQGLTLEEAHALRVQKLFKSHCSAFIKLLKDEAGKVSDVMVTHGTWDDYIGMLKVMKKYDFKVKPFEGESEVDYKMIFPGYPGSLTSQDDYYVREKGFIVMETSLNVYDETLYDKYLDPKNYLPTFLKLAAANFFGNTAEKWADYFSFINTGTMNSQWMIVDVQAIKDSVGNEKLKDGSFYVVEQLPGLMISKDMTGTLNKETYWSSFNLPYFDETYALSGAKTIYDQTGSPDFSRTEDGRAKIFREMQSKIHNIDDLKKLIRLNRIGKNGYSVDGDTSQSGQIASRYDLSHNDAEKNLNGETDAKISNIKLAEEIGLLAVSGPTPIESEPFSFSDDVFKTLKGMPKTWDFEWRKYSFGKRAFE